MQEEEGGKQLRSWEPDHAPADKSSRAGGRDLLLEKAADDDTSDRGTARERESDDSISL